MAEASEEFKNHVPKDSLSNIKLSKKKFQNYKQKANTQHKREQEEHS